MRWSEDFKYEFYGYVVLIILIVLVISIFKFFMFGLPSSTLKKNEELVLQYESQYKDFESKKKAYASLKKEPFYKGIKKHEVDEQLLEYFHSSSMGYKNIEDLMKEISRLIDKNSKQDKIEIDARMKQVDNALKQIVPIYQYPFTRLKQAKEVYENFDHILKSIDESYQETQRKYTRLKNDNKQEFDSLKLKTATMLVEKAERAKEIVDANIIRQQEGEALDFLAIYDSKKIIENTSRNLAYFTSKDKIKSEKLLFSEAKILIDMKVKYYCVPERYSWNRGRDYSDRRYEYAPVEVGYEQYQTLLKKEDTKLTTSASPRHYNHQPTYTLHGQKIFYLLEKWPWDSTSAEFWLKALYPKYYHRYMVIKDDGVIETDWIEVNERVFYRHISNFGMQIYSKPYGTLPNAANTYASPPAMSFVDNSMYGKWKEDVHGRYWTFSAKYEEQFSPYMIQDYYTEDEYKQWKKSQIMGVDFYGVTHRYGTYSPKTYQRSTHLNSHFVRLYIDLLDIHLNSVRYRGVVYEESGSGGASSGGSNRSAKSSGRSLRGGGPGGYGK